MDLKVFITNRDSTCDECGEHFGHYAWITLVEGKGALCLSCADLDHLVFLPSGDAALTRRAGKYSTLSAVVLKWSRARKRYERQGLLVEEVALQRAEQECLDDADARACRNERQAERRAEFDQEYVLRFAARVRELFPNCPAGREHVIAEHACQKYSGRVGRSAQAKALDEKSILLAVRAHIRHAETNYDGFLAQGFDRLQTVSNIPMVAPFLEKMVSDRNEVLGEVYRIIHPLDSGCNKKRPARPSDRAKNFGLDYASCICKTGRNLYPYI